MNLGRKLVEGVGAWLHYEYVCDRSELFSEKYLSVPIGGVLRSVYDRWVFAEFKHPSLAASATGPGRRPEIDFAVLDPYPNIAVAIESKWVGKRSVSVDSIIWDLIRLEMVAFEQKATCYFVLAGQRKALDRLFSSLAFTGPKQTKRSQQRPILRTNVNNQHTLILDSTFPDRTKILKRLFKSYQDTPIPSRILSVRAAPFPRESPIAQYQVYCWEVRSKHSKRKTFLPADHRLYGAT